MTEAIKAHIMGLREDSEEGKKALAITTNTLIPISLAAVVVASIVGATWTGKTWLDGKFETLKAESTQRFEVLQKQAADLHLDVESIRRNVSGVERNRWTAQDAEVFALKLKLSNPNMAVPDVGEIISRRIQNDTR